MSAGSDAPPPSSQVRVGELPAGRQTPSHAILADGTLAVIGADVDPAGEHRRIRAALGMSPPRSEPASRIGELVARAIGRIRIATPNGWTASVRES